MLTSQTLDKLARELGPPEDRPRDPAVLEAIQRAAPGVLAAEARREQAKAVVKDLVDSRVNDDQDERAWALWCEYGGFDEDDWR